MSGFGGAKQLRLRVGRRLRIVGLTGITILALAGCTVSPTNTAVSGDEKEEKAAAKPVVLKANPRDGAANVAPGEPITVSARRGTLTKVTLTGEDGTPVKGKLSEDGKRWVSAQPLGYSKTYTAKATGENPDGKQKTTTSTFTTATPQATTTVSVNPMDGETVGVGQPLVFTFSTDIPDKAAAERALRVATEPATDGAFYWFDDSTVHWRPKEYWTSGTKVDVNAAIYGKDLGGGLFGAEDQHSAVTIGDKVIAIADGASYQMKVSINDKPVRSLPISMGRPGYDTPSGKYVVMSEHQGYTMDSSTYGVAVDAAEGYRIWVEIATRMSNSGIFYHSAPWSVYAQGNTHTSHGCINLSPEDSRWLQSVSNKGDVMIVKNTGGPALEPTDGWGDWQIPWQEWLTGGERNS
ncbi:MAG: L,D-transpeptidase family protein [Pseudonocardiaceae bacterium]|nr:L,D-transpeptidase family protein [Pseudonocardiaceae bacterium]